MTHSNRNFFRGGANGKVVAPGASLVNVFNIKEVSHRFPEIRVPIFLLPSQKNGFGPKNGQIWPKIGLCNDIFGPFGLMADQKQCEQGAYVVFLLC